MSNQRGVIDRLTLVSHAYGIGCVGSQMANNPTKESEKLRK